MKVGFGGDFFLGKPLVVNESVSGQLQSLVRGCDAVFVNFEGPVVPDAIPPSFKTGPNLRQWNGALEFLSALGASGIGIANNHAADYGTEGLRKTVEEADSLGLLVSGVTRNDEVVSPVVTGRDGLKLAVLSYAEHEWCGDTNYPLRISIFDPITASQDIRQARLNADALVVCLHGNNEHSSLPSPDLVRICRFLIDSGADAVVIHHAHAISGMETYRKRPIVYGLGNFMFTYPSPSARWNEGLFCELSLTRSSSAIDVAASLHPVAFCPDRDWVDFASAPLAEMMQNELAAISVLIESPTSLQAHFDLFVTEQQAIYDEILNPWWQKGRLSRLIGRIISRRQWRDPKRGALLLNALRCASHRAAMTRLLEMRLRSQR